MSSGLDAAHACSGSLDARCSQNLLQHRFTVNIISEPFISAANFTSVDAPADVSEWELSGLTPVPSTTWGPNGGPPRVGESAFTLECELYEAVDIYADAEKKNKSATLILGQVKKYLINEEVLNEDLTIDPAKFLVSRQKSSAQPPDCLAACSHSPHPIVTARLSRWRHHLLPDEPGL